MIASPASWRPVPERRRAAVGRRWARRKSGAPRASGASALLRALLLSAFAAGQVLAGPAAPAQAGKRMIEYPVTRLSGPVGIAPGPDGNLWFTEVDGNRIGKITT